MVGEENIQPLLWEKTSKKSPKLNRTKVNNNNNNENENTNNKWRQMELGMHMNGKG